MLHSNYLTEHQATEGENWYHQDKFDHNREGAYIDLAKTQRVASFLDQNSESNMYSKYLNILIKVLQNTLDNA